jgi:hypothetical protein
MGAGSRGRHALRMAGIRRHPPRLFRH